MNSISLQYIRNVIAIIIFSLLRLFFPKKNNSTNKILFIHTAGLGDLIYSNKIISNIEKLKKYESFFLIKKEHQKLFNDYNGKVRFIFLDYYRYRLNLYYRLKMINSLRSYSFEKVFQLNHNRRIIDDDLALNSGGSKIIALNKVEKKFPKLFKQVFDKMYDDILFYGPVEIENKIDFLLKNVLKIEELSNNILSLNERSRVNSVQSKFLSVLDKEYIVINPVSTSHIRDWKIERFIEVIRYLLEKYDNKILLLGSENHVEYLNNLRIDEKRIINLAGITEILESFVIVKNSKLFIGIDSALSHVAKYYNVPRVLIVGGGPYGLMFTKQSFYQTNVIEKILYYKMDCFGCNWYCIHQEPFCLTNLDSSMVVNSIRSILEKKEDFNE